MRRVRTIVLLLATFISLAGYSQNRADRQEVYTEILLRSSPQKVWEMLTDFEAYPRWHTYLIKVEGEVRLKKKLHFVALNLDSTQTRFSAFLITFDQNKELAWGGSLGFLFKARHYFRLEPVGNDQVKLVQGEYWRGWFGGIYGKKIYRETYQKFVIFNQCLKKKLEDSDLPD